MKLFEILYMPDDIEYLVEMSGNWIGGWIDSNSGQFVPNESWEMHVTAIANKPDVYGVDPKVIHDLCPQDVHSDEFFDCISHYDNEWGPVHSAAYDNGWVRVFRDDSSDFAGLTGHFNHIVSTLQNGSLGRFLKGYEGRVAVSVGKGRQKEMSAPWGRGQMSVFHYKLKELGGKV